MKICMLGQSFLPKVGGEELGMDLLAREFLKRGHEVTVHVQHRAWLKSAPRLDVPYRLAWYRKARSRRWAIPFLQRSLKQLHRDWPFEILYCRKLYPPGYAALLASRVLRVPLVLSLHDTWTVKSPPESTGRVAAVRSSLLAKERRAASETLTAADAIIALNQHMRAYILSLCPTCADRVHLIPNGVEVDCFTRPARTDGAMARRYANQHGRYFLFMGRLDRSKGVDILIEAFRLVLANHPDAMLIIAGDGSEKHALQQQTRAAGLEEHVHWAGVVRGEDRIWLMQHALCVVVPSRVEPFGKVTVEAFACGTPVVGSRLGGIAELIEPGINGLLTEAGDVAGLGQSLRQLLTDPVGRDRMGVQARATAQRYAIPVVAQQCLTVFDRAIQLRQEDPPGL
jgi:glycosyltransferase involved in cell wall biosynthesis